MGRLPERQARQEFRKIAREESRRPNLRYGIELRELDIAKAIAEATRDFPSIAKNLPERASVVLAEDLVSGKSSWRVRTGYSKSRFKGDRRGIINDASYAPFLEAFKEEEPARKYAEANIKRVADEITRDAVSRE